MSAFGLLSPLITQAAQARGGYLSGQQEGQQLALKNALAQLQAKRQADQEALAQQIGAATIREKNAQADKFNDPSLQPVWTADGLTLVPKTQRGLTTQAPQPTAPSSSVAPQSEEPQRGMAGQNPEPSQQGTPPQQPASKAPAGFSVVQTGLKPVVRPRNIDPNSPEGIAAALQKQRPTAPGRPIAVADPTSSTGVRLVAPGAAVGQEAPRGGMSGGMGSGGIGGIARQAGAIVGMSNAHQRMVPYENDVLSGKANYNGWDGFKGQYAKMYDAHGALNKAAFTAAIDNLNQTNPALANYLVSAEQWALEDSQLSGKSSDFRTKLDAFVSAISPGMGGGANPQGIRNVQGFRTQRIAELEKFRPAMEAMAGRAASGGRGGAAPQNFQGAPASTTSGNIDLRGSPTPSLTPEQIQRAKVDPEYAAFLKATGKMP